MTEINLTLTIDQVNLILAALGERPFKDVFELVDTIQSQAGGQLNPPAEPPTDEQPERIDA